MSKKAQYRVLSDIDRATIAVMLNKGASLSAIARETGRSLSTIIREIRNHATVIKSEKNNCQFYFSRSCVQHNACGRHCPNKLCRKCRAQCWKTCGDYSEAICDRLCESPYVCNGCPKNNAGCRFNRTVYDPATANKAAYEVRHAKSAGYDYTDDELDFIDRIISPLIKNGLSPYAALKIAEPKLKKKGISLSRSTLYRMIDRRDLGCRNIDLPEKVSRRRPKTKKRNHETPVNVDKAGHLWKDYLKYMEERDVIIPQMDCVEGKKKENATLLTLYWKDTHLQIAVIMDNQDSQHVVEALDMIEYTIELVLFRQMLPAILTDNGKEFSDIEGMERSCTVPGEKRTQIFFCEPNRSDQKGGCERNHREMRKIIPKGRTSLESFMQDDIILMMNHVNSYPRESLYGRCPYDVAKALYPPDFLGLLGMERIPDEQIVMKPSLLADRLATRRNETPDP